MPSNLDELDYVNQTILVTEAVVRTSNCALSWTQTQGQPTIFVATLTFQSVDYNLSFIQNTGFWSLSIAVLGRGSISISSDDQPTLNELAYELTKKETSFPSLIRGIRSTRSCDSIYVERGHGGVRVGGNRAKYNKRTILMGSAGIEVAGESPVKSGFFARGGAVASGEAEVVHLINITAHGGTLTSGGELPDSLYTQGARISGNTFLFGLYEYTVKGTGHHVFPGSEAAYNNLGVIGCFDVDCVNGKIYTADSNAPGMQIFRRNLDYSNPELLFTLTGSGTSGELGTNMRYDRFDNLIWLNFIDLIRYNVTTNTFFAYHPFHIGDTTNPGFQQDVAVFGDSTYVLCYTQPLNRYSKAGTLISSVQFHTIYNISIFCMAEDYDNDVLWVGGNVGSPIASPIGTSFIGKFSKDLTSFTQVYTAFDPDLVLGMSVDNINGDFGYVQCGFQSSGTKLHKFALDGSGTTLVNTWGNQPSNYGQRIYVRT